MLFKLLKSAGIAHHSYFIGSGNIATVIDPRRDIEFYLELAKKNDLEIKYIFETHRNEDYVIGSLELQNVTDAEIFHGKNLNFKYGNSIKDGDKIKLNNIELEVLETPGHTFESISIVLRDLNVSKDPQMAFTGDVIFAGEAGRIDFYGRENRAKMADLLYRSIFEKIIPLGDQTLICPAHGAGSVCGADIREQDFTTIGYERKTNPLLKFKTKEAFIEHKVAEELYTPTYFNKMEIYNLEGPPILCKIPILKPISVKVLKKMFNGEIQLLDVRNPTSFGGAHIKTSINIWKEGISAFAGWFLNYEDPIIIIDDFKTSLEDVTLGLIRLGYDNVHGYLSGGFPAWYLHAEQVENMKMWTVQDLKQHINQQNFFLLDVRKIEDRKNGHIQGSEHVYVGEIPEQLNKIPKNFPLVIYCDSGYKSTLAASYLKKIGFDDVTTVLGGMNAWKNAKYELIK
jgi:hydroxyacylglutathione hydrolase